MPENLLYYGDNLEILRRYIDDESVDLVYLDPPFKSNQNYNVLFAERSGTKSAAQIKAFEDTWQWDLGAEEAFRGVVEGGPHPRSSGRRLSILEESTTEQLVLARMVALQDEGHGCSRIASTLNLEGFLSPRTRKPWSRQGVWKVLRTAGKRGV
jgi:hypothetical protein